MTERATDQQPMNYSELRRHASRLEVENKALRKSKANQRRELRRLNAKLGRMVDAFRATDQPMSREEALAEASKMQKRARLAEFRLGDREEYIEELRRRQGEPSHDYRESTEAVQAGENGKAAE